MNDSFRAGNHYKFRCPVVGRDEYVLACALRKHKHWRGEAVESDCATCMNANKCPWVRMQKKEWRAERPLYFEAEPGRVHGLHKDIWEEVNPVLIVPTQAYGTGITPERLSELMGTKIEAIPDHIGVPPPVRGTPASAVKTGKVGGYRKAAEREKGDLSAVADGVLDLADHINDAMVEA